jgi:hypothetical protein
MKQQKKIVMKTKSQNREGIEDALTGMYRSIYESLTRIKTKTGSYISFLIQNYSKGPPGHT